ncbi:zinc-binding dehydrogenase [Rhizobium oryzicola]|uniref:Zinc-binding dehydrogenase n=1 Tax=Rhizobium oryzicola TaxID=1232668 RepID=A0ABT8SU38_9HYPH|nr:zinc-binding dehydrogenase [Rhizobium oryzicola]MDO1581938.1 zinc-binding dehydrogenase [Rhizobium oryzicola]
MRAISYSQFGKPSDVVRVLDVPTPVPGPGEVLLRMHMAPIHNHDLLTVEGRYGYKPALPALGGSEGVGTVEVLGEGVSSVQPGQRVAASGLKGAWAEFAIARAASVVPLPDAVPDEVGAQLIAMPLSALTLLEFAEAKQGQWLIQNAATGAVAKVVSQLAKFRGIHVINLVRRAEAVAELEVLGIGQTVSTAEDGWKEKVRALTGGQGISVAVDSVGGKASGDLLSLLGENGLLVSFGLMSGEPMQISSGDLIFKQATVKGFWLGKLMETMPREQVGRLIGELVKRAASGELVLQVDGIYPLAEGSKALAAAAEGGRQGKVLIQL